MTLVNNLKELKIVNRTVYNTEDIRELLIRIQQTLNERGNHAFAVTPLETLEIGLYRPASYRTKLRMGSVLHEHDNYCSDSCKRVSYRRLGIAPPDCVAGVSPLEALAMASGDVSTAPHEVVASLFLWYTFFIVNQVFYSFRIPGSKAWIQDGNTDFFWLKDVKIRLDNKPRGKEIRHTLLRAKQALLAKDLSRVAEQIASVHTHLHNLTSQEKFIQAKLLDMTEELNRISAEKS